MSKDTKQFVGGILTAFLGGGCMAAAIFGNTLMSPEGRFGVGFIGFVLFLNAATFLAK